MSNNVSDLMYYKQCPLCDKEFVYDESVIYKDNVTRDIIKCPFCEAMLTADRIDVIEMLSKYL